MNGRWMTVRMIAACVVVLAIADSATAGIDPESDTDGYNPAAELYDIGEAQRLNNVARQLDLNRWMIWSSMYCPGDLWGPPIGGPPVRQPTGYESKQVAPNRWIYRPLYSEDFAPGELPAPPMPEPLPPPPAPPDLPAPSDAQPEDFVPPERT